MDLHNVMIGWHKRHFNSACKRQMWRGDVQTGIFHIILLGLLALFVLASCGDDKSQEQKKPDVFYTARGKKITITPIKHASLQINYDGREFEIDPVCSHVGPVLSYLDKPKADFITRYQQTAGPFRRLCHTRSHSSLYRTHHSEGYLVSDAYRQCDGE